MGNRSGRFGWFLGVLIGAVFGVLFAPRKGKELRDRIKADRKKGKLGIAPLSDDFRSLGQEMAGLAKDIYHSDVVQDVVEVGRKKLNELSGDFVEDVHDFHKKKIEPLRKNFEEKVREGKETFKKANRELKDLRGKMKQSSKISKKAVKDISHTFKKRDSK